MQWYLLLTSYNCLAYAISDALSSHFDVLVLHAVKRSRARLGHVVSYFAGIAYAAGIASQSFNKGPPCMLTFAVWKTLQLDGRWAVVCYALFAEEETSRHNDLHHDAAAGPASV